MSTQDGKDCERVAQGCLGTDAKHQGHESPKEGHTKAGRWACAL